MPFGFWDSLANFQAKERKIEALKFELRARVIELLLPLGNLWNKIPFFSSKEEKKATLSAFTALTGVAVEPELSSFGSARPWEALVKGKVVLFLICCLLNTDLSESLN